MTHYIALDGGDGVGKSTQAHALVDAMRSRGLIVDHLREPGSTRFGEAMRALLLDKETGDLDPRTELLAFSAARAQMLVESVETRLAEGVTVVSERCCVSTLVYQCLTVATSDRADPEALTRLWCEVSKGLHERAPIDLLFVLDLPVGVASGRRVDPEDRIEARGTRYHERVRAGFRRFAEERSLWDGIVRDVELVDASAPTGEITERLIESLQRRSGPLGSDGGLG